MWVNRRASTAAVWSALSRGGYGRCAVTRVQQIRTMRMGGACGLNATSVASGHASLLLGCAVQSPLPLTATMMVLVSSHQKHRFGLVIELEPTTALPRIAHSGGPRPTHSPPHCVSLAMAQPCS
jgi:hypothetical protein